MSSEKWGKYMDINRCVAELGAMRFVLTYTGPLPSNGDAREKHTIRKVFLPQLARYWQIDEALNGLDEVEVNTGRAPIENIRMDRGGFRFVPICSRHFHLSCFLEITLYRDEAPGTVIQPGGDIDNRIKTLFDSLTVPIHANQLTGLAPEANENPFYCLLEDDSLITGFQIQTERLLQPLRNPADVSLTIAAIIRPTKVTLGNIGFLGGWL
jgi:hypothetical protein